MTDKDAPLYPGRIEALRETGKQLPTRHGQLARVRHLIEGLAGQEGTDPYQKAQALEREILGTLEAYRHDVLKFGAVGRLMVAGEIEALLPLDDAESLDAA